VRRLLYATAALCLLISAGLWAWVWWPGQSPPPRFPHSRSPRLRSTRLIGLPPASQLRELAQTRLRRPLVDPPPKKKPTVSRPSRPRPSIRPLPRLQWRLIGTVLESDRSAAILIDGRGRVRVVRLGQALPETAGASKIEQVEADRVVVSHRGRQVELTMPKPTGGLR